MAINLPPLFNGLRLINTGLAPGDRQGDTLRIFATKVNENAQITLTENDDIAGNGLTWNKQTRKLALTAPPGHLIIGSSVVPYNNLEFSVDNDGFSVKSIDASKIIGEITSSNVKLNVGKILVGNSRNIAAEVSLGPEFKVNNNRLELNVIPWNKITDVAVTASGLSLANNKVFVGNSTNKAEEIELGPDFAISNGRLAVTKGGGLIGLYNLNASNAAVGRYLGISGTETSPFLEWKTVTLEESNIVPSDDSVTLPKIKTVNKPSALGQLTVTEDGEAMQWYPSVDQIRTQRNYVRYLNNMQRRVNLDNARSIAELQNANVLVLNNEVPSIYTTNVADPVSPQFIPGKMYIAGGVTPQGFLRTIEAINYSTELVKVITVASSLLDSDPLTSQDGLVRTKEEAMAVASSSHMYICGRGKAAPAGVQTGTGSFSWNLEKFNYSTQAAVNNTHQLATKHRGGVTMYNYKKGYFYGGIDSAASTVTMVDKSTDFDYASDSSTVRSNALANASSLYRACAVTVGFSTGYSFGGCNIVPGSRVVSNTIAKYTLNSTGQGGSILSANLGSQSPHRMQACALDDEKNAYIFNGASGFSPTGANESNPTLDLRLDGVSKFSFSTEAIVRLSSTSSATKRSSQTASASISKGYIVGGVERVRTDINYKTWTEKVPDYAEKTKVKTTTRQLTGSTQVITGINASATTTVNVDYDAPTVTVQVPPPNVIVNVPKPKIDIVAPPVPPQKSRYNG